MKVTIRRMSRSVRPNDMRLTSGRIRWRVMALGRVNSRSPSAPCIRPNPDSPTPPNGNAGTIANPSTELIEVIPLRNERAAVMAAENSLMAIQAGSKGDVTTTAVKWKFHKSIPQLPSLVLYRGVLYMINDGGVLTTLNASTGELFKQARLRGVSDRYFASPVAADGKIFIAANSGVVAVLKAGGDQELLAANKLDEEIFATPAIADGRIYVRTTGALYCFGEK